MAGKTKKKVNVEELEKGYALTLAALEAKSNLIKELEAELEEAYKTQDAMLAEVDRFTVAADDGFESIAETTEGIIYSDVMYHITFFRRVMHKKYGPKSKTE